MQSIGGVLALSKQCNFTKLIKNEIMKGNIFYPLTPFKYKDKEDDIMIDTLIVFTNMQKTLKKSNSPHSHEDHYCVVDITNDIHQSSIANVVTPIAKLNIVIGPCSNIENKYKVLLHMHYERSIIADIQKVQKVKKADDECQKIIDNLTELVDDKEYIISIDPEGSTDIDDAVSVVSENEFTIYIADTNILSEYIDQYYRNYTSIYLGNNTYHLLPKIFSTDLLSLIQGKARSSLAVNIELINGTPIIKSIKRKAIIVSKNMSYDKANEILNEILKPIINLDNKDYSIINTLFIIGKKLAKKYYTNKELVDTHDLIELLMITTNNLIGQYLYDNYNKINIGNIQPVYRVCNESSTAIYSFEPLKHTKLQIDKYVHFTSPIRRFADHITHKMVLKLLGIDIKIDKPDLDSYNKHVAKVKIMSNIASNIYAANLLEDGSIYHCKLIDMDGGIIKWHINQMNYSFTCHVSQIEPCENLQINSFYKLKLYRLAPDKFHFDKITFMFI